MTLPALADFLGDWAVARRILDRPGGQEGSFRGIARFRALPDGGLSYHEEGLLVLGRGMPLRATRDYLWRAEAGLIVVSHGDGRPFHAFDPADPAAEHLCGRDLYRVRYDFARWPLWRAEWQVAGPAKEYRLVTDHAPAPAAAAPDSLLAEGLALR